MVTVGNFTMARAVREWYFVQVQLMALRDFQSAAKARGLDTLGFLDLAPWETLDREDLLPPVAYALHGFWFHDHPESLACGALLIRDEVGFTPWADLSARAEQEFQSELTVLYHPWQLLWLGDLQQLLAPGVPWGNLGDGLDTFFDMRARIAGLPEPLPRTVLIKCAAQAQETELLLVRTQDLFMPQIRGGQYRAGAVHRLTDDAFGWTRDRQGSFDYHAAADDCGVSANRLGQLSGDLGVRGHFIDPNRDLFWLMDQVKRSQRERLQGTARRALDYYDAARVLRAWNFELTGKELPDVDGLVGFGGDTAKQRLFGTTDLRGNRAVLPALLDLYDLYPYRVELIGEGDSELAALREIFEVGYGTSFERLGIHTIDMTGADMPPNTERLLTSVRTYANYFLLVFDNEGRARAVIEALMRAGVLEGVGDERRAQLIAESKKALDALALPEPERARDLRRILEKARELDFEPGQAGEFLLWRDNLEADNFTVEEICAVVAVHAEELGVSGFALNADAVRAEIEARSRPGQAPAGLATVVVEMCEASDPPLVVTKPDLARRLARHALAHPERDSDRRPILELAEHLYRLAASNRRLPE
jgi:hypothetical protein